MRNTSHQQQQKKNSAGSSTVLGSLFKSNSQPAPGRKAIAAPPPPSRAREPSATTVRLPSQIVPFDQLPASIDQPLAERRKLDYTEESDVVKASTANENGDAVGYVIRGIIVNVLYPTSNGAQCVRFKEYDIPEDTNKKRSKKHPKESKPKDDGDDALDFLTGGRRKAEEDEEENAIDLDDTDDEEDDEDDEDDEKTEKVHRTKAGYVKDDFVVEDKEAKKKKKKKKTKDGSSSSSSSSSSENDGSASSSDDAEFVPKDKKAKISEEEKPQQLVKLVASEGVLGGLFLILKDKVEGETTDPSDPIIVVSEDEQQQHSVVAHKRPREDDKNSKEKEPDAKKRKIDEDDDVLPDADVPGDIKEVMDCFSFGGASKEPSAVKVEHHQRPNALDIDDDAVVDETSSSSTRREQPVMRNLAVSVGKIHKVVGKFPTTSPLICMDIRVRPKGKDEECVEVIATHRLWEGTLTKKKFVDKLTEMELCDPAGPIRTVLGTLGGRATDPMTKDGVKRITDQRFSWMCAGMLNTDWELSVSAVLGCPIFESVARRGSYWPPLEECLRYEPEKMLFAEERLTALCNQSGLTDLNFEEWLKLPNVYTSNRPEESVKVVTPARLDVIYAAKALYDILKRHSEFFGDTMVQLDRVDAATLLRPDRHCALTSDSVVAAATRYLIDDNGLAVSVSNYLALQSSFSVEKDLAFILLQKKASIRATARPEMGVVGVERSKIETSLRPDLLCALENIETSPICVIDGPDEVGMFVMSTLSRLHPKTDTCVACFNPRPKHATASGYKLPQDNMAYDKHIRTLTDTIRVLVLTEVHYASSNSLLRALRNVPVQCKIVLVGDSHTLTPIPTKPEIGRPFAVLCESAAITQLFVGSQIPKNAPEMSMERLCTEDGDQLTISSLPGLVLCPDIESVDESDRKTILVCNAADKKSVLAGGWFTDNEKDAFKRRDLVLVRNNGIPVAAGRLVCVKTGFGSLLATDDEVIHQPLAKTRLYSAPQQTMVGGKVKTFPVTSSTYANTEVVVELDDSGFSGRTHEVTTRDRRPFVHLNVVSLRNAPPFKTPRATLILSKSTTSKDICAASKIVTEELSLVGSEFVLRNATKKAIKPISALGYVLAAAVPATKT